MAVHYGDWAPANPGSPVTLLTPAGRHLFIQYRPAHPLGWECRAVSADTAEELEAVRAEGES